jgi:radical SAM superfamily enzyme YgiQ (UPF0313 family)
MNNIKTDISLVLMPNWGITDIPLTLSSLSSYLRANGIKVKIFDFNIELFHLLSKYRKYWDLAYGLDSWEKEKFISELWDENNFIFNSLINDLIQVDSNYVGFSLFVSNRLITERFAKILKMKFPDTKIIFGGPEISYIDDLSGYSKDNPYVDYFVRGEGEEALLKIVKGNESERLVIANNIISNLDKLPFMDFSDFDFESYYDTFSFPMYSSRGCPNSCIYCTERNFMIRFRSRSAERLFEEIKEKNEKYPFVKLFRLHESVSNGDIRQLEKFCDLMINSKNKLKWSINGAVMRKEMNYDLLKKLHKAGCIMINYGLETPSHIILENIGKRLSKNTDFEQVVRDTHKARIRVALNIMFGLPGETEEDFRMQIKFLQANHKYISIIAPSLWFCYFPKGSEGFRNPDKYNIDVSNGSLFWHSKDGTNNYLIRMNRFIKYTDLMEKLGVQCAFGYPVLPNRNELLKTYYDKITKNKELKNGDAKYSILQIENNENRYERRESMIKKILRSIIYKIAPYSVDNAISEKARARILENRLNKLKGMGLLK